jgi:octaprenyl-diphosphate synthase
MADDLLDYTADTKVLGKPIGTDLKEGKLTLPVIYALNRATGEDRRRLEIIIQDTDITEGNFETVLKLIKKYGGITYTRERAQKHIEQAKTCLDIFSASKSRTLLEQLADYVPVRKM